MPGRIYPYEQVENSLEAHLARHSRRSQAIYVVVVIALLAAFGALPFLRVQVSVQSAGLIRPTTEKHELNAHVAGFVETVRVREHQVVHEGEVLLVLRSGPVNERAELVASQVAEKQRFVHDLERLTRADINLSIDPMRLRSAQYKQEYAQLANEARENRLREEQAERELERVRALYDRQLVSQRDLEDRQFQLGQVKAERATLVERYVSGWHSNLTSVRMQLRELQTRAGAIEEERRLYTLRAPVTGTMEELASISPGSYIQPGQRLAVVSPRSELVSEVYVSPRDIGLIRPGGEVRMQIDAFNYSDWGFITGRVAEISQDFVLINQQPMFRVRTTLDQDHLALKNGFRGQLKKGMTLQARFSVTERTLLQLLRDDVNDWLNPTQSNS